jgi:hypothetical protein
MGFWTQKTDPKRKFNFDISITGQNKAIQNYYVKTCTKPSFTVNAAEHNYLNHTFYYPGRVTWNDVSLTFVDPGTTGDAASESTSAGLVSILLGMGYNPPSSADTQAEKKTISKSKAVTALGDVNIRQLDEEGDILDEWVLINAWITEVNFGDLDYTSDDLVEVTCTIKYDFAKFSETAANATHTNTFQP